MDTLKRVYEKVGIGGMIGIPAAVAAGALITTYYVAPAKILNTLTGLQVSGAGFSKKSVTVGEWTWSYFDGGKKDGAVIVYVHGFSDTKMSSVEFLQHFTKKYRVIVPDLPGHGDTLPLDMNASYSVHKQVERLHSFLERILPIGTKYHIIGHSMGGNISGLYGVKYPDELLTVGFICNGGVLGSKPSELSKDIAAGKWNWLITRDETELDDTINGVFYKPPPVLALFNSFPRLKTAYAKARCAKSNINTKIWSDICDELQHSLDDQLQNIQADTFILWGRQDKVLDVSQFDVMLTKLPKPPSYQLFDECGHTVITDCLKESVDAYTKFLERSEHEVLRRNIGAPSI